MIPHVTHNDEADITELEAFRKRTNGEQSEAKVTMVALLAKAVVASLKAYPIVNSSLDGDDLVLKRYYNIGFAADTPNGLVVPVIKDADKKGILEIAKDLTELSKKARDGKLAGGDMQGSTFTISSLGGIGGTSLHADRQRARGRDPRRHALGDEAGLERLGVRAAPDGAAVAVLRPPGDRRRARGALRRAPREPAVRPAEGAPVMEVKVPDIGDFDAVPVIEILVGRGDEVAEETPLVVLESDKATMEVPSPAAGKVTSIEVAVGDKVAEGTLIVQLEAAEADAPAEAKPEGGDVEEKPEAPAQGYGDSPGPAESPASPTTDAPTSSGIPEDADVKVQVAVFGAGPGGYTAAFRAADLGLSVALIDQGETLGGVCLNVGCIPSKALLHVAKVLTEAEELAESGISFGKPTIDIDHVRGVEERRRRAAHRRPRKASPSSARSRSCAASASSPAPNSIKVGDTVVGFEHCIIASGSEAASLPFLPEDPRIMDSTGALEVEEIPERLLVIGGGIIGLEMATVYDALGSKVTVVELLDQLIPGADKDLVRVLEKRIKGRYEAIHLKTGVESVEAGDGRPEGQVRRATSRRSTASWSPSAAARTARSSAPRPRA